MLLSFILCNFLVRMLKYFLKNLKCFFDLKKLKKKTPQKVAYLWQLGVFFSAAPTAQNSPELHFRFINSFIQPSLVGSLMKKLTSWNRVEGKKPPSLQKCWSHFFYWLWALWSIRFSPQASMKMKEHSELTF